MQDLNQKHTIHQSHLLQLSFKLSAKKISEDLRNKAIEYHEYTWSRKNMNKPISNFSTISESLQNDILFQIYKKFIVNCPMFIQLEQIEICKLIRMLESGVYMPGENIIY